MGFYAGTEMMHCNERRLHSNICCKTQVLINYAQGMRFVYMLSTTLLYLIYLPAAYKLKCFPDKNIFQPIIKLDKIGHIIKTQKWAATIPAAVVVI